MLKNRFKPPHPGLMLSKFVETTDNTIYATAKILGVSRQIIYDIADGKKNISPQVAAKLGKLFGTGTEFWLLKQAEYDAAVADEKFDISKIPTLEIPPHLYAA